MNFLYSFEHPGLKFERGWNKRSLEEKLSIHEKIMNSNEGTIPVIITPYSNNDPQLKNYKYIIRKGTTLRFLLLKIRENMLNYYDKANTSILFHIDGKIPLINSYIDSYIDNFKDGFVYIKYSTENTFG